MYYDLQSAVEEWLARLPDDDWQALIARTRPPAGVCTGGEGDLAMTRPALREGK
ncbi:hypothetical protein MSS2_04757 [Mycobacterium marinum]|nr:hypothetical protein MSS2_04757 [Mycobacterium marinum]